MVFRSSFYGWKDSWKKLRCLALSQHYDTKNGTFTARFTEMRHLDTLWKGNETYIHEEADPFEVYTRVPTPPISSYYPGSSRFAIALSSASRSKKRNDYLGALEWQKGNDVRSDRSTASIGHLFASLMKIDGNISFCRVFALPRDPPSNIKGPPWLR